MAIWKKSAACLGAYEVSDTGIVRRRTTAKKAVVGRVLCPQRNHKGYLVVFPSIGSIKKTKLVHRLVAEAFIPNPKKLPQVNHKDGDKENNAAFNLEWCDNAHNQRHSWRVLGARKSNLTTEQARAVKQMLSDGVSCQTIANHFGVSKDTVWSVKYGKAHV